MASTTRIAILVVVAWAGPARAGVLADHLATDDPGLLDAAVRAIEAAPGDTPELPEAMYAAARAAADRLHEPARALALDQRIVAAFPDRGVAVAAKRHADQLRAALGGDAGASAPQAAALSALIAAADRTPPADVIARATTLADAPWPGAPQASLWLAEWLRRRGQLDDARARYAATIARWPASAQAAEARRGQTACAIEARDWDAAERLAAQLPSAEPADREVRANLIAAIAHGRWRGRLYAAAWIALALITVGFTWSLVRASRAAGRRWRALKPPGEVLLLGPPIAVLVGASFTANRVIAPAVALIAGGGLVLAWLSGAALNTWPTRARARGVVHVAGCVVGVLALASIALVHGGLLELLVETVRFGPGS